MRFSLLLSAALLPLAVTAHAEDAAPLAEEGAEAEPIIVTAARTTLPITALPLTAEVIDRAGGDPDLPVFSAAELAAARQAVDLVTRLAAAAPAVDASTGPAGR